MKHLFLSALLGAASLSPALAQTKAAPKTPAKPAAPAAATTKTGKPLYAGFLINGKLVSEIDCYGFDKVDLGCTDNYLCVRD